MFCGASIWHEEEQPSPDVVFPSSHCSPDSTTPLPQTEPGFLVAPQGGEFVPPPPEPWQTQFQPEPVSVKLIGVPGLHKFGSVEESEVNEPPLSEPQAPFTTTVHDPVVPDTIFVAHMPLGLARA